MTDDEQLAAKIEEHAKHGSHAYPALLYAAAERIYALSAMCALLKASLAHAEREAEAAQNAEPFGYFHATPFGWEACAETDEGAKPLYERPVPVVSAEPVALPSGFLSDVLTAAGLVAHGRRSKGLAERLGAAVIEIRSARKPETTDRVAELEREACADAESDAGRLALELECLLLSISDMPTVSRWWDSANEAMDLHRSRLDSIRARGEKGTKS